MQENKIINGLWIGSTLSKIELLTIHSFIAHGHDFQLWAYDEIEQELPPGAIIKNADEIIPKNKVFCYSGKNQFGHGKGSYAGFSDIFRYKLLYEKGGWWVDMDVCCLKPFTFAEPYLFRTHHQLPAVGNIMKCPRQSQVMKSCYEEAAISVTTSNTDWHKPLSILNENIEKFGLSKYIRHISNHDKWEEISSLLRRAKSIPEDWYAIHWANENWRANKIRKNVFRKKSVISILLHKYGIDHEHPSFMDQVHDVFSFIPGKTRIFMTVFWVFALCNLALALFGFYSILLLLVVLMGMAGAAEFLINRLKIVDSAKLKYRIISGFVILGIFTAETGLRFNDKLDSYPEKMGGIFYRSPFYFPLKPDKPWLHLRTPNISKSVSKKEYQYKLITNGEGLRDVTHPLKKSADEYRIVALGDSFTEGDGVADPDSTWVKLLESQLGREYPNKKIIVINGGVASSDPFFELLLLKQRLLKYKPDLVLEVINKTDIDDVIIYGGNERFVTDGSVQWQKPPWFEPLFGMSYLCRIIAFNIFNIDWLFLNPGERVAKTNQCLNLIYNCMMDFKQLSQDHGFGLLLVFHPLKEELISEYFSLEDLSIKTKNTPGLNVANMWPFFNSANAGGKPNIQDYYWPVDGHFTSKGNQVFADGLTEKIVTLNLIKEDIMIKVVLH